MKGMTVRLAVLISSFMIATSLQLKGNSTNIPAEQKETTKVEESFPGNKKEIQGGIGKKTAFLCRAACALGDTASSARKGNSSRCQILLGKLSGNDKAYKQAFNLCTGCACNPKTKKLNRTQKISQIDLRTANSFRSPTVTSRSRNSNSQTGNSEYVFPQVDSQTSKYSQKYNPWSKNSESGFVPVPGPYGFKSSTTQYPRSEYRSDSYEDITDSDYHDTSYDEEDILGSSHFEILKGGIFPYNDNNHLGRGHRGDYASSYRNIPKNSKAIDITFNDGFPYSFPDILSTERRSEITQATNGRAVLSRLFATTNDLDTAD